MKRTLSALLALVMAASLCLTLASCSGEEAPMSENVIPGKIDGALVAVKVGTLDTDSFTAYRGGLIYQNKETQRYGVMSLEGRHDTGAIFTSCFETGLYFAVTLGERTGSSSIDEINSAGIIDGKGNTIVPPGFAHFYLLNDRYIMAYRVTEKTSLLSETLLYLNDHHFLSPNAFGTNLGQYAGEWCVIDTVEGNAVPGVYGTTETTVSARGPYLTYKKGEDYVTVGPDGEPAPKNQKMFDDGSYAVEDETGKIYSAEGTLLFEYDPKGLVPTSMSGDYYLATRYGEETTQAVMDKTGKVLSAELPGYFTLRGDIIEVDGKLYNFQGKQIIDGSYSAVLFDKMFGENFMLHLNDTFRLINKDGSVVFTYKESEATVDPTNFIAATKKDDVNYVYSHADKDFTIKGYGFAPWLAKDINDDGLYRIVDTISGKTLLEGYKKFDYSTFDGTKLYVYAYYDGGADAFIIINEEDVVDVEQKKADLLADLTAAFQAEGISIEINAETGEMALDTSVLFGGDSAVVTSAGKDFLKKFAKVYHSIAFSDEYDGFISKTLVEGHIAPVSGSTYESGLPLSEERAANVLEYCLSDDAGVDLAKFADEFEAIGYSNSQPVYNENGEVNMAASRRVSFRFMISIDMI
ncbi:MAG: OmpA family protein [Oscillospiraceae bacterium]|nr:OmpA family protein [Oscillospiraceae bacterium]